MDDSRPSFRVKITQVCDPDRFLAVKIKQDLDELNLLERKLLKDFHNYVESDTYIKTITKNDIVAYYSSEEDKCYRALVETVFVRSHGTTHRLFLVDHGKRMMTNRNNVRPLSSRFADVPYRSCYLVLPGLRPVTIGLEVTDDITAHFRLSEVWDEAAKSFVNHIVRLNEYKAQAEILRSLSPLKFEVRLHFGEGSGSRCLNELLLLSNFAIYDVPDVKLVPNAKNNQTIEQAIVPEKRSNNSEERGPAQATASMLLPFGRGKPIKDSSETPETKHPPSDKIAKFLQTLMRGKNEHSSLSATTTHKARRSSSECDASAQSDSSMSDSNLAKFKPSLAVNTGETSGGFEISENAVSKSVAEKNASLEKFKAAVTSSSRKINSSSGNTTPVKNQTSLANLLALAKLSSKSSDDVRPNEEFHEKKTNENSTRGLVPMSDQQLQHKLRSVGLLREKENSRVPINLPKRIQNPIPNVLRHESRFDSDADLVFSFGQLVPASRWLNLQKSNIHASLLPPMTAQNILHPYSIQSYSWPAVSRLLDCVLIGASKSGKSVGYLIPLMSSLLHKGTYSTLPVGNGPIVIILCASCTSAFNVFNRCQLLLNKVSVKPLLRQSLPLSEGQKVELLNGCDILVTLPDVLMSSMTIGSGDLVNFNRLCHLVIDDAHVLMTKTQMIHHVITTYKCASTKLRDIPHQIIVCGESWSEEIAKFANTHMSDPVIYMSCMLEACVFTNMKLFPTVCIPERKDAELLSIIPKLPNGRIVIFTSSKESVVHVKELLRSRSYFVHMAHAEMQLSELTSVKRNWVCQSSANTQLIFVLSDDISSDVTLRDANVLIHYEYCENRLKFRYRFGVMTNQLVKDASLHEGGLNEKISTKCSSYLIITNENDIQANYFCNILKRFKGFNIPRQLAEMAEKHSRSKANPKIALCSIWKALGHCKKPQCKGRHVMIENHDVPEQPVDGVIELTITFVVTANRYYAKLKKLKSKLECKEYSDQCKEIAMKMQFYYATPANSVPLESVQIGSIGAIRGDDGIHYRVRITEAIDNAYCRILYIDTGKVDTVQMDRIFKLPDVLEMYQAQVVELILGRVQPADGSTEWGPNTTKLVRDSILNQSMTGTVIMTLGRTFWVDKLVKVKYLSTIHCVLKDFDVVEELTKNHLAVSNPDHLKKILCSTMPTAEESTQWSGKNLIDSVNKLGNRSQQQQEANENEVSVNSASSESRKIVTEENSETESTGENLLTSTGLEMPDGDSGTLCSEAMGVNEEKVDENANIQPSIVKTTLEKKTERDLACSPDVCVQKHNEVTETQISVEPTAPIRKLTMWEKFSRLRKNTKPSVAELSPETTYKVYASSVLNPGLFYVQREDFINRLDELTTKIRESELHHVSGPVSCDNFYLVQFPPDTDYFRVRAQRIKTSGEIEVFSVDYGDERTVMQSDLRILENEFLDDLPFQAISCRLAGTFPLHDNEWSLKAGDKLWKMVTNEQNSNILLSLNVNNILSSTADVDPRYEVTLTDGGKSLGDLLVEAELAAKSDTLIVNSDTLIVNSDTETETETVNESVNDYQRNVTKEPNRSSVNTNKSSDSSTAAQIIWYETPTDVVLKVMLAALKSYNLRVELNHVHFSCIVGNRYYSNDLDLFSSVNYEYYESNVTEKYLLIRLTKANYGRWPHLLKNKTKVPWLTFDFDHIALSDESDCEAPSSFSSLPSASRKQRHKFRVPDKDSETSPSESDDDFVGDFN